MGRAKIEVFRCAEDWHPYPWRFRIKYAGKTYDYAGIPNQCETKRSASMRARWRAKWLEDGTYHDKYKPICILKP